MKLRNTGCRGAGRWLACWGLLIVGALGLGSCTNAGSSGELLVAPGDALDQLLIGQALQASEIKDTGALRYNQVQQKSSHNSFSRDEGILDQLVFHRLRSIEFDIYRGKLGRPGINNDWYVYHTPIIDTGTSCDKLSACFGELRAFDRMHPDHEVTTVWFDIKDGWGGTQNPNTFDALVRQYFSDDDILKPADLLAACPGASNLKQAITGSCAWPTLNSLKGKWIFVLVAGGYSGDRVGFTPGGTGSIAAVDASSSVFYNQGSQDNNVSNYIYNQGFVSRRYVLDDANGFNSAIAGNIHHIATNRINYRRDGWSKTHNALGWPFRCLVACDVFAEAETVLGIEVNSEDIWGRDDHFAFAYQDRGGANGRWIASVTGASSHIDQWAKGCLMARANTASNSPYFAVCRPGDNRRIRIQWRDNFGNNSGASETNINHAGGLDQPNLTFMKMDVYDNGRCAAGFGSPDGERWTSIGSRCFNHTLALQGASGSSHGNVGVRHLFSNLTYWDVVQRRSSFDVRRIGTVRSEKVFDGSFDTPGAVNLYDLGTATSPLFKGYRRLDAGRPFSGRSFGWTDTSGNQERDRGAGAGNRINRDLVFNSQPRTFEQIVPNGDWYAMITFGDIYRHDNQAVDVEGVRRLSNITTQANEYRNEFVAGVVTDGRFSIRFADEGGGDPNWTITRLVVQNTPFAGQAPLP